MAQDALSLRAYAQHRKASGLPGGTLKAVQKAIADDRISVVTIDGRTRIADPAVADREWAANTDHVRSPGLMGEDDGLDDEGEGGEFRNAAARERHWKALTAELNYRQRAGELVNAADLQAELAETFSTVRTRVLGIPSKLKQRLPHLSFADLAAVDQEVREALEELAPPAGLEDVEES
jgi:hypothetical protein